MINHYQKSTHRTATLTYVAESERDADRLRGQLDAPVRVQSRRDQVTLEPAAIEQIAVTATETLQARGTTKTLATTRPSL